MQPLDDPSDPFHGPWFDAKTAAAYTRRTVRAWYQWRQRHGIVVLASGLVAKRDIDRALKTGRRKRHRMAAASLANLALSSRRRKAG